MELRYISKNEQKIKEVKHIFDDLNIKIISVKIVINEIQDQDNNKLIMDKLLKAFAKLQKPLFLEHTGLYFSNLYNYPGGLTESFWKSLGAVEITKRFGEESVVAKTTLAYCDGKKIFKFEGETKGQISVKPMGNTDFQWDTIFIPENHTQTFAQLGNEKNKISMRYKAIMKFYDYIKSENKK